MGLIWHRQVPINKVTKRKPVADRQLFTRSAAAGIILNGIATVRFPGRHSLKLFQKKSENRTDVQLPESEIWNLYSFHTSMSTPVLRFEQLNSTSVLAQYMP